MSVQEYDAVLGINRRWRGIARLFTRLLTVLMVGVVAFGLVSCSSTPRAALPPGTVKKPFFSRLAEVAPPATIRELETWLAGYQPQVKIIAPRANEILQDTQVTVRLQVNDLPLFQDSSFGLGPHLQVVLDNQTYSEIYDVSQPLLIEDLTPGTHTLRVFAVRPWEESFKNEGAYAQTTFHVFTPTPDNAPDPNKPLLTYNAPRGVIGAEPVLLDFYLTNVPLHLVAQESAEDDIPDWQIRCTINGESFTFDRWEPIYLTGLKPGKNWVQLELLDERGNAITNTYNNTVHLVTYEPGGSDPLSQLIRGELTPRLARSIVDPTYVYVPEPEPEPEPAASEEEPVLIPEPLEEQELVPEPPEEQELPEPEMPTTAETEPTVAEPSEATEVPSQPDRASPTVDEAGDESGKLLAPVQAPSQPETQPSPTSVILDVTPDEEVPAPPGPPELMSPSPLPVEIEAEPVEPLKTLIPEQVVPSESESAESSGLEPAPVPPAESGALPDAVPEQPEASGLLPLFDQVKGFFERLRRQPTPVIETPLLVPTAEPVETAEEATPQVPTTPAPSETPSPEPSLDSEPTSPEDTPPLVQPS